jgi:hypothetical protein
MLEFWKSPKFWIGLIIILWLAYVLSANLEQSVTIFFVPFFVQPIVRVSSLVGASMIAGCVLTLLVQWAWRRRASKYAAASVAAAESSNNTVA